ncbi:MAG TPA: PAS domain S-box protein [Phototrophicaceae bacterium]|nr:PAS domain S-box protein [Phototrophicaceae bacterium]
MESPGTQQKLTAIRPGDWQDTPPTYQDLLESTGYVFFSIDVKGYCVDVSPTVETLLGYRPDEVLGKRIASYVRADWQPETKNFYARQYHEHLNKTVFEYPIMARSGEEKWVEQTTFLLQNADEALGYRCLIRDITRYKHVEFELEKKALNLTAIVNHAQDSLWSIDRQYRLLTLNEVFKRRLQTIYGLTFTSGMSLLDYGPPEENQFWTELYGRAFGGENFTVELDYNWAGIPFSSEVTFTPIYGETGEVNGAAMVSRNISERKQAENALRASEERYRSLVENALDVIFTLDDQMRLTSLNPAFETTTGWQRAEWLNRPFVDIIHPDDLPQALEIYRRAMQAAAVTELSPFELRIKSPADTTVIGEFKVQYQTEGERVVGVLGIARDVTERKRVEAERDLYINQLEVLQEVDNELSQILQVDYVLTIALDAAVRLSKADAGAIHLLEGEKMLVAQVIGDYPRKFVGSYVPLDRGIVGRVVRSQQPEWVEDISDDPDYQAHVKDTRTQITIPLISRDRTIGVLNVQANCSERFTQRSYNFLKLLTARIAAAIDNARLYQQSQQQLKELQQLYQQVSQLEQLKTEIIRIAAHDLRNPLGVVSGYTQMLGWELEGQNLLSERFRDHLKMIKQSVERIDKITRDILTLERIEGMVKGVFTEQVNMTDMIRLAFEECMSAAAEKRLDYQSVLDDQPLYVIGDTIFLRESVHNLLGNAIKYTPEGGKVHVRLQAKAEQIVFEVEDTGYGIPEEHQANLFQPFYRAVTKETKTIRGTGLGLHLVKQIIERHNGRLYFTSVYQQGSTFGFALPQAKAKPPKKNKSKKNTPPKDKLAQV